MLLQLLLDLCGFYCENVKSLTNVGVIQKHKKGDFLKS